MPLTKRDRISYYGFLAFWRLHSIQKFEATGKRNPDYIADVAARFAQSVLDTQDRNFDITARDNPGLIEQYGRMFQSGRNRCGLRSRREFSN